MLRERERESYRQFNGYMIIIHFWEMKKEKSVRNVEAKIKREKFLKEHFFLCSLNKYLRFDSLAHFTLTSFLPKVGKIPGIIFKESNYLGYLLKVNTFAQGAIGYYPRARVFTAVNTSVNTRGIYF